MAIVQGEADALRGAVDGQQHAQTPGAQRCSAASSISCRSPTAFNCRRRRLADRISSSSPQPFTRQRSCDASWPLNQGRPAAAERVLEAGLQGFARVAQPIAIQVMKRAVVALAPVFMDECVGRAGQRLQRAPAPPDGSCQPGLARAEAAVEADEVAGQQLRAQGQAQLLRLRGAVADELQCPSRSGRSEYNGWPDVILVFRAGTSLWLHFRVLRQAGEERHELS